MQLSPFISTFVGRQYDKSQIAICSELTELPYRLCLDKSMSDAKKVRILAAHGWRTSAKILEVQTLAMKKRFGPDCEIVCFNAKFPAKGPPHAVVAKWFGEEGPFYEHYDFQGTEELGWTFEGLQESLEYLHSEITRLGPFNLVFGFSQGAALLTFYIAMMQNKNCPLPFRGAILCCGPWRSHKDGSMSQKLYNLQEPLDVLSLHIFGKEDPLLPRSEMLARLYVKEKQTIVVHPGGHMPPSWAQKESIEEVYKWLVAHHFLSAE